MNSLVKLKMRPSTYQAFDGHCDQVSPVSTDIVQYQFNMGNSQECITFYKKISFCLSNSLSLRDVLWN